MKQEYKTHHENNIDAKKMHICKRKGKKTIVLMTKKKKKTVGIAMNMRDM